MHQSPAAAIEQSRPHKRSRREAFGVQSARAAAATAATTDEAEQSCTTSGESSSDESSNEELGMELEEEGGEDEDEEEEEALLAAKRRRRTELDGLKKSVRRMELQVVGASAQLRQLSVLLAEVAAARRRGLVEV